MIGSEFILFSDLLVFSLELITDFAVGDFLSFAYPKERKQRKGNPDQTAFPHSNKIFLTKSKPILATLRSGVTFLKILSPFGRFGRGMRLSLILSAVGIFGFLESAKKIPLSQPQRGCVI
ncbi:hypothetical protein [Avibacterium avium]|uniref:hypothetical protein n=1 Tax=Avibacterium avium TaxID=751 RepID=UPI003BF91F9A